ncbi:hypothetical protein KVR01_000422 [Diaporthe batatas]|uniref:uncharacterized protein n=1 Tax=Diaporthe batatas TaxID=748121 RepID=UPI001D04B3DA|nr:uncharacterized protein KVR01_000422 [Diaporthe batatas]KAG8169677.1 hypothetical protein KVR01_000422 [Diaporthe batatas]
MASPAPQAPITSLPPQIIVPTAVPVLLTTTSPRGSFIESLPTRTATTVNPSNSPLVPGILASTDSGSGIVGPATTITSSPEGTAIALPGAAQGGAISDKSPQFPTALIAGVSGGVIAFIFIFALLWRWYLRRQSARRQVDSMADEKGLVRTHDHDRRSGPFQRPADRIMTTKIWTGPKAFKSDQTRFSWAATEVSLGDDLEPLTPKPVIQQTVHRVSVPLPVEASSFRTSSKEGSVHSSVSQPKSSVQQAVVREVVIKQVGSGRHSSPTQLPVTGTDDSSQSKDVAIKPEELKVDPQPQELEGNPQPEELEGDPVPSLSDFDMETATLEKEEEEPEGPGLKRQYTLTSSPLHQNPFRDPVEEEEGGGEETESPMFVTFEMVNTETPSPKGAPESEPDVQRDDGQERSSSPVHVPQTITLTAEDLKRASTAKTIAE